jgi:hypothetical protein
LPGKEYHHMSIRKNQSAESIIEDRGATIAANLPGAEQRDEVGNTIEDDGIVIGTPTPELDERRVREVMDAIDALFTDNEERTSMRTGEVYISNKRAFPGKMMLRQFVRQIEFDLTGLKKRIVEGEAQLAREHRKLNADPRELAGIEQRVETLVDAFAERTAMRRVAVDYYPDLTGEYYEQPSTETKQTHAPAKPVSDWEQRQKARAALIGA